MKIVKSILCAMLTMSMLQGCYANHQHNVWVRRATTQTHNNVVVSKCETYSRTFFRNINISNRQKSEFMSNCIMHVTNEMNGKYTFVVDNGYLDD